MTANVVLFKAATAVAPETFVGASDGAVDVVQRPGIKVEVLAELYRISGGIRTCIAAYQANIEQTGHMLVPTVPVEGSTALDLVAQAMHELELADSDQNDDLDDDDGIEPPNPEAPEVAAMLAKVKGRVVRERLRVGRFLKSCGLRRTFRQLRELRRLDLERFGDAYWEVVREPQPYEELERDSEGNVMALPRPALLTRLNPQEMELTKEGPDVLVYQKMRTSIIGVELRQTVQRFRLYRQRTNKGGALRWFKTYGDPRLVSHRSGKVYASTEEMLYHEPAAQPATEVAHFILGEGPYGEPRWYGEVQSVVGVRGAQESNVVLLNRGGIPGLAIVVTDGALTDDATKAVKNWVDKECQGPDAMNKVLVIQADGQDGKTKVQIEKLNGQQTDGLFMAYIELGYDLIGRAFRLPKLLCGDAKDMNRATAEASLDFAESQVFQPERAAFDDWFTQFLFEGLDIRFLDFKTNAAQLSNATARGERLDNGVKAGWLTPNDARALGGEVFGVELPPLEGDWANQPLGLTLAGFTPGAEPDLEDFVDPDTTSAEDEITAAAKAALARLRDPAR